MSIEIIIVFALLIIATFLFVWERISFDITALIIMSVLMLTGILSPSEGLSGFSNKATITIAAMFIISEGIRRTGGLDMVGDFFGTLGKQNFWLAIFIMMIVIGFISAFINNTAAVAIFIPIIINVSIRLKTSASKLLMPLSFASMFGGVCTLLGTSTNILVSSIAQKRGLDGFTMFEFAPLGIILLVVGFIYLFTIGIRLIPERRSGTDLTSHFEIHEYLTDVVLEAEFAHLGEPLDKSVLLKDLDLDVIQVFKRNETPTEGGEPQNEKILERGDILRIRGSANEINKLLKREDISIKPPKMWYDNDLEFDQYNLVEAVIAPDSPLENKAISEINFPERFGAVVLALRHHGKLQQEKMEAVKLSGGDSVLLMMDPDLIPQIKRDSSFVLATKVSVTKYRKKRLPIALGILVAVVGIAALGILPIVVVAVTGAILLVLTGCLTTEEAHRAINWKVIFLLGGVLPLGIAMDKTGAAQMLSHFVINHLKSFGPRAILSGFFLLSMLLTNVISNQATAALLAPIVIKSAQTLQISPHPFLIAITFAASLSFMTPVGYQTNTLVYGPGQYKFTDYTKVGTPLNIIFWILATLLIPVFWPF